MALVAGIVFGLLGVVAFAYAGWLSWHGAHPGSRPATVTATQSDCRSWPMDPPVPGLHRFNCTLAWNGGSEGVTIVGPDPASPDGQTVVIDNPPPVVASPRPWIVRGCTNSALAMTVLIGVASRRRARMADRVRPDQPGS